jgi:hypothetical protein
MNASVTEVALNEARNARFRSARGRSGLAVFVHACFSDATAQLPDPECAATVRTDVAEILVSFADTVKNVIWGSGRSGSAALTWCLKYEITRDKIEYFVLKRFRCQLPQRMGSNFGADNFELVACAADDCRVQLTIVQH